MNIAIIINGVVVSRGELDELGLLPWLYQAGYTLTDGVLHAPDGSVASTPSAPADLGNGVRILPVVHTGPEPGAGQYVASTYEVMAEYSLDIHTVLAEIPVPPLVDLKAAKRQAVQAEKCRARDGGFLVDGVLFDSDASAQIAYLQLAFNLAQNPTFTTLWKASENVWVTMDAALFTQVAQAGAEHIGAVFAWQSGKDAEISRADTVSEVNAIATIYSE